MRVAIIHYWLVSQRGGESVLESLLDLYPDADIYTHVLDETAVSAKLSARVKKTSFISCLPRAKKWYPWYLPLMPFALRGFDLGAYDLIISSESGPAKGFRKPPGAFHLCYCHSPMRYLWDQEAVYMARFNPLLRLLVKPIMALLRHWDVRTASTIDYIVCNSHYVQSRVKRYWHRDCAVVYPPVAIERFPLSTQDEGYYLYLGQLVAYKQPEALVQAFNRSGKTLVIAGDGELMETLQALASDNIRFAGRVSDAQASELLAGCKALVFPGEEDFGIVPLEAMSTGKPVLALARGGALETVVDGKTGLFFPQADVNSINEVIERFENAAPFDSAAIRAHAVGFSKQRFGEEMSAAINQQIDKWANN